MNGKTIYFKANNCCWNRPKEKWFSFLIFCFWFWLFSTFQTKKQRISFFSYWNKVWHFFVLFSIEKKNSFSLMKLIETKYFKVFSADIWFAFEQSREKWKWKKNIDHYWITMLIIWFYKKIQKLKCRLSNVENGFCWRRIKNSIWLVRSNRHRHTGHQDLFVWKIWKKSKED